MEQAIVSYMPRARLDTLTAPIENIRRFEVESIETAGNLLLWGMDDLKVSFKIVADGMREVDRRRGQLLRVHFLRLRCSEANI